MGTPCLPFPYFDMPNRWSLVPFPYFDVPNHWSLASLYFETHTLTPQSWSSNRSLKTSLALARLPNLRSQASGTPARTACSARSRLGVCSWCPTAPCARSPWSPSEGRPRSGGKNARLCPQAGDGGRYWFLLGCGWAEKKETQNKASYSLVCLFFFFWGGVWHTHTHTHTWPRFSKSLLWWVLVAFAIVCRTPAGFGLRVCAENGLGEKRI